MEKPSNFTMDIEQVIRPAKREEAGLLSELCLRSKAYWPYDKEYLEDCIPLLKITEKYISEFPVFVCERNLEIVGFSSLMQKGDERWLDNLWVEPHFIGSGVGRDLYLYTIAFAKTHNWLPLRIAADPGAEPFYIKMGAKSIGAVESRVKKGLMFPLLEAD
jgi:hypothetical protein